MVENIPGLNYIVMNGITRFGERTNPDEPAEACRGIVINLDSLKHVKDFVAGFYDSLTCEHQISVGYALKFPLDIFKEGKKVKPSELEKTSGSLSMVISEGKSFRIAEYLSS